MAKRVLISTYLLFQISFSKVALEGSVGASHDNPLSFALRVHYSLYWRYCSLHHIVYARFQHLLADSISDYSRPVSGARCVSLSLIQKNKEKISKSRCRGEEKLKRGDPIA